MWTEILIFKETMLIKFRFLCEIFVALGTPVCSHHSDQWVSKDGQLQHHLGACEKCRFSCPTPDLLNQTVWGGVLPAL